MKTCLIALLCGIVFSQASSNLIAQELAVDLQASTAAANWLFLDETAMLENGELLLDGRQKISRALVTAAHGCW